MTINWIEVAQKAFDISEKKTLHVDDIASCIQEKSLISKSMPTDEIKSKVNASLASHVKKKGNIFTKPNKKGQKRGYYSLKRVIKANKTYRDPLEDYEFEKHFRGKAGEYAFISELLFRGYNAAPVAVDVGMDIIAHKDNKAFHIQVKTSKQSVSGKHTAQIKETKFAHANDIYYVVVLRTEGKNEFFIITSNDLRTLKRKGVLGNGENINISLSKNSGKFYLYKEDVQHHINDFKAIR